MKQPGLAVPLFFVSSLVASFFLYLWLRPGKRQLAFMAALALPLAIVWIAQPGQRLYMPPILLLASCGVAAIVISLAHPFLAPRQATRLTENVVVVLIPPVGVLASAVMLAITSYLTPITFDYFLYTADGSFGFQPGFWGMQVLQENRFWLLTTELAYFNLPAAMALLFLYLHRRDPIEASRAVQLFFLVAVFGVICYNIYPSSGTVVTFKDRFPYNPPALSEIMMVPAFTPPEPPRNCIPSLHTAWILAMLWSAPRASALIKWLLYAFSGLTLFYTLSCGHYLVDLVTGFPFTLAVYALCRPEGWASKQVRQALLIGCGLFAAWLGILRFGISMLLSTPAVPWTLSALTIAISWMAWRSLAYTAAVEQDHSVTVAAPYPVLQSREPARPL